jgi:hypothetical protein
MTTHPTPTPPYVAGALVRGVSAHILSRLLRSPNARRVTDNLPADLRAEFAATAKAIHRAALEYEALPVSPERSDEALISETVAASDRVGGWLTTGQVASRLGVSIRRAEQLASAGMGHKVGHIWRLDPTAVHAYERERQAR